MKKLPSLQFVSETFKDFTEQTSIHGFKYICRKNVNIAERLFWTLAIIGGTGMAFYMTSLFWDRYTSNPTRTTIRTLHAPTLALPFPAVTICNENIVIGSKVEKFMDTLKCDNCSEKNLKKAFHSLQALTHPKSSVWDEELMQNLSEVLNDNNYNLATVMEMIRQDCKELLVKCQWEFKVVNCMEIFMENYSKYGLCCTFYGTRRVRNEHTYTENYGTEGTLSVIINPRIEKNIYSMEPRSIKVLFHDSLSYPEFRVLKKIITTGTQTHMQILGTRIICSAEVAQLAIDQRECIFPGEVHLKYFKTYSDANCLIEREADEVMRICGCVPFYFDFSGKRKCNIQQISCFIDNVLKNNTWQEASDFCPASCEDFLYQVKTTHVKLEKGNFHHLVSDDELDKLEEHTTHLKIYFIEFQKVLRRDLMYTTISLIASFGGIYSLLMGCSFLTICEIFYYLTLRLMVNRYIFKKQKKPK